MFWAAGVKANAVGASLGVPLDTTGRVIVGPDLTVPSESHVFIVGDLAAAVSAHDQQPVPGVAQAAIQMGRYAGKIIREEIKTGRSQRKPFSYQNKGTMATIGQAHAVAQIGSLCFTGFIAWLLWGVVHVLALVSFRNRLSVAGGWVFHWLTSGRSARLITGKAELGISMPIRDARVHLESTNPKTDSDNLNPAHVVSHY